MVLVFKFDIPGEEDMEDVTRRKKQLDSKGHSMRESRRKRVRGREGEEFLYSSRNSTELYAK